MYSVDVYLRVRRAVMVEGKSIREVSREFGLHRDTVRKLLAILNSMLKNGSSWNHPATKSLAHSY